MKDFNNCNDFVDIRIRTLEPVHQLSQLHRLKLLVTEKLDFLILVALLILPVRLRCCMIQQASKELVFLTKLKYS